MRKRSANGFTLMELLMVVAIIGIIAAIAIPNILSALNRSKQKKTMADMRTIATAWEARQVDFGRFSAAGLGYTWPTADFAYDDLTTAIVPTYIRKVPPTDGWGNPFDFGIRNPDTSGETYGIRSAGKDAVFESSSYVYGPISDFDCDLVYSSGNFVQYALGSRN